MLDLMRDWPAAWRAAAQKVVDFFETKLRLVKGRGAGKPYLLPQWFEKHMRKTFGPLNPDGTRRVRVLYLEVARKNSKSTSAGGLALYMLTEDGEAGAEVYPAAHDRQQAKIVFNSARAMAKRSKHLNGEHGGKLTILTHVLEGVDDEMCKMQAISSDSGAQQGLDPHCVVIDELHVLTRELVEVLETASGARSQPLTIYISTAGEYDPESVAWERHLYGQGILDGSIVDPTWEVGIYSVPETDRFDDEAVWPKANPNLGVSVNMDYLRAQCRKAKRSPAAEAAFRRYHLNQWVANISSWVHQERWLACEQPVDVAALAGQVCCSGLDLSTSRDLTAHVMVFPRPDEAFDVVARLWMPMGRLQDLTESDQVPYPEWVKQGWITLTEGDVIDYMAIRESIEADWRTFRLKELAFDPWGATQISQELDLNIGRQSNLSESERLAVMEFRQGYRSMSEPTKYLVELVTAGKIRTGGNPVLRWMSANAKTISDPAGNIKLVKPDRKKDKKRIDGIVALVMAIARAKHHKAVASSGAGRSTYEDGGIFVL